MTARRIESTTLLLTAFIAGLGFFAVLVFWPAGRLDWAEGWLYLLLIMANLLINSVYLQRANPEVIEHRLRLGKGTKRWDKVWLALFTPIFFGTMKPWPS